MFAVILERCNKSLQECFGTNSFADIPFFDISLNEFLDQKISSMQFSKIYKIHPYCNSSQNANEINIIKKILKKTPDETIFLTYSDVCFADDSFMDSIKTVNSKTIIKNSQNEVISCVLKCTEFLDFLSESKDLYSVFCSEKELRYNCGKTIKVIDDPLKYKELCNDVLTGRVCYRLPEIAQGIYVSDSIPNGDFVLIPPVYFGDDIQIEKGCVIGPGTVISNGVLVAENSRIRNTVVGENTYISSGCHSEGSLISCNVVLRRNSVVFDSSVLCHDVTVGEDAIVEKGAFIRSFSNVDEYRSNHINYKIYDSGSTEGFYGYSPEKAALLGAAVGICFDMPRIAIASDGELNSTALKLSFLGGLITTGAACFDFGNSFFSSLYYFINFCELDCGAFISGNDNGTVITIFRKGETSLSRSDFYNIKSVFTSNNIARCEKENCKSIRQIHGMQRMYVQNLTNMFDDMLNFEPIFNCDNQRIKRVMELAVSKIGLKNTENRVVFNINFGGTRVSALSDGVVYPFSKLLEVVSFYERKHIPCVSSDIVQNDAVFLSFCIIKILSAENSSLKQVVENLPRFYVAEKNICNSYGLRVLAADLSHDNKIEFKKDEIFYKDGLNSVKINKNRNGSLSIKAKSLSMETATEIIEKLTRMISERESYNY